MIKLARWLFAVCGVILLIDVAFFGPGLQLSAVPFSIRRVLFLTLLFCAAGLRLRDQRSFTRAEVALIGAVLTLVVGWAIFIPLGNGYKLVHAIADVSAWMALLAVAVWPWPQWHPRFDWRRVRRIVIVLGAILAVAHVILWALLITETVTPTAFYLAAEALFGVDAEGDAFIRIAEVPGGYRIFWTSSIFLLAGIYFLLAYRPEKRRLGWWVTLLLLLFAMWTTQIRAFIGAFAIFAMTWTALRVMVRLRMLQWPRALVLAFWMASVLAVSVAIHPGTLEAIGLEREKGSDSERLEQAAPLLDQFLTRPVLGSGFGSYASGVVRSDDAPFSYELTFYALLMKLGIVGTLLLGTIFAMALRCVQAEQLAQTNPSAFVFWTAFTTGLWFSGATNPMVTNFVGMGVIVLLFVDLRQQVAASQLAAAAATATNPITDTDSPVPAAQLPAAP